MAEGGEAALAQHRVSLTFACAEVEQAFGVWMAQRYVKVRQGGPHNTLFPFLALPPAFFQHKTSQRSAAQQAVQGQVFPPRCSRRAGVGGGRTAFAAKAVEPNVCRGWARHVARLGPMRGVGRRSARAPRCGSCPSPPAVIC